MTAMTPGEGSCTHNGWRVPFRTRRRRNGDCRAALAALRPCLPHGELEAVGAPGVHRGLLDALEPRLAPIGVDLPRAEPAARAALAGAHPALEDDRVPADVDHPAVGLLDQLVDPGLDAQRLPAVAQHLPIEREAAVHALVVERGLDLLGRAHADELAGLQVERLVVRCLR